MDGSFQTYLIVVQHGGSCICFHGLTDGPGPHRPSLSRLVNARAMVGVTRVRKPRWSEPGRLMALLEPVCLIQSAFLSQWRHDVFHPILWLPLEPNMATVPWRQSLVVSWSNDVLMWIGYCVIVRAIGCLFTSGAIP